MFGNPLRWFSIACFIVIAAPLFAGILAPESAEIVRKEKRPLNEAPSWPRSFEEFSTVPAKLDAYVADRFGLRHEMTRLYANLNRRMLRSGGPNVLVGDHDRMFYRGDDMLLQSAGIVRRDQVVHETVEFLSRMRDSLAKDGIRFVVASPPNAATIYSSDLPLWIRNHNRITEYDMFVAGLRNHSVNVVDLRGPLRQAGASGKTYSLHDTHWTPRGSIIGFNSIAEAAGHPGWKVSVETSLSAPKQRHGGDLARMIGVDEDVSEDVQPLSLSDNRKVLLPDRFQDVPSQEAFSEAGNRQGETLLVLGDSFTLTFFAPLLVNSVGKLVWSHHEHCGFDWNLIKEIHPDEVWWIPTERYLICRNHPKNVPSGAEVNADAPASL